MKKYIPHAIVILLFVAVVLYFYYKSPALPFLKKEIKKGSGTNSSGSTKGSTGGQSSGLVQTPAPAAKTIKVGGSVVAKTDNVKLYTPDMKLSRIKSKNEFVGTVTSIKNGWVTVSDTGGNHLLADQNNLIPL